MPKSRTRKKKSPAAATSARMTPVKIQASPTWLVPTMLVLLLVGLAWILVTSLSSGQWPIPNIGYWNLLIGFAFVTGGGILSTRWH